MARETLNDKQWVRLLRLLPAEKPRTGRPARAHRQVVEGMYWLARTGAPWRDLPPEFGPWRTVATRFYRWRQAGVFDRVLAALQADADARGELDWLRHFVGSTIVRAHQHAAGAKGGSQRQKRSAGAGAASVPNST